MFSRIYSVIFLLKYNLFSQRFLYLMMLLKIQIVLPCDFDVKC